MSKEEVVCSDLDNTVHNSPQCIGKNSNASVPVEECFLKGASKYIQQQKNADVSVPKQETDHSVDDEENDIEEYDIEVMTGSYGEICLEQKLLAAKDLTAVENKDSQSSKTTDEEEEEEKFTSPESDVGQANGVTCLKEYKRPNSLVLKHSTNDSGQLKAKDGARNSETENAEPWKKIHKSQQTSDSQTTSVDGSPSFSSEEFATYSPRHERTGSDTSGLTDLQGTITVDGDMVTFIAEDLHEKIRLSSPVSKWADSPSYSGSRSSTPSLYRQALQAHIPLVDAGAVADLEQHAKKVATCVDTMLENLSGTLQSISSLTVDYMETYEKSVCKTCDTVDTSIKTMYQLMAKCEELSNSMKPLYRLSQDIKDMKKVLDHFENAVEHRS